MFHESPAKKPVESNCQQRRSPICRRQSLRDDLDIKAIEEGLAEDRPRQARDPRRIGSVLGQAGAGNLWISVLGGREDLGASLQHSPRGRRSGRLCVPAGRRPIRALDLQRAPTGAGSGDCRNQSLWPRRRGVGNRTGPRRGARAFPGYTASGGEHHSRFRLRPISSRRPDRMGRDLRNCVLRASFRRRQKVSRGWPHRHWRRRQRQLLVAIDNGPVFSPDGP